MTSSPKSHGESSRSALAGPVVCFGFLTAVAMWCAAFVAHFPGLDLPGSLGGPAVLGVWLVAAILVGRGAPRERALAIGTLAGMLAALLGVLILGSMLVEQPTGTIPAPGASGLTLTAMLRGAGFVALGGVIGAAGGAVGSRVAGGAAPGGGADWLGRFGLVVCAAIAPLLLIGGAVTSTNSGMAIRGWPDSYGANMFLYPLSLMVSDPKRFLEHSHRLFGSLTGLTTLTLMVWALAADRRRWVKALALILFAIVCLQGILGGARVNLGDVDPARDNRYWSLVHGILAQVVFALAVALAVVLGPSFKSRRGGSIAPSWRRLKMLATGLFHSTILQLVLGATYRHLKAGGAKGASHALLTHIAFSLVVLGLALGAGLMLRIAPVQYGAAERTLRRIGTGLVAAVGAQFLLGWGALWAVIGAEVPGAPWLQPLITTLHQANGALVLGLATAAFVWVRGLRPAG